MSCKYYLALSENRLALVRTKGKLLSVVHLEILKENVKPLYNLSKLVGGKRVRIITGIPCRDTLIRTLEMKIQSQKKIRATLPFQLETLFPSYSETLLISPHFKREGEVTIVATKRKVLTHHLEGEKDRGVDPDIISCEPSALYRFARHYFPKESSLFLLYVENEECTFVAVSKGDIVGTQTFSKSQIERICAFMQKRYPHIEKIVQFTTSLPTPFQNLEIQHAKWAEFALPIGLALDGAKGDEKSIQFREKDNRSNKDQKRERKQTALFMISSLCFILTFSFLGKGALIKEEKKILNELDLKQTTLDRAILYLERSIHQKKGVFPLSNSPKVYELIHFLSNHPNLRKGVSITRLSYQIIKGPRLKSKVSRGLVKVELAFQTENGDSARNFHDALMRDKDLINQEKGIKWRADDGLYSTTFYLKEKKE